MIKYIKAAEENKAEFVSNFGKFLSDQVPQFRGCEFHYIKPTIDNPVDIFTTSGDTINGATYGEFVRVICRGNHIYDINVSADSRWGIVLDCIKYLKNDF